MPCAAVPDVNVKDVPKNRLSQYQLQQQRVQHFWRRWSHEYLNTMQQRTKWKWESEDVQVGDLVLIADQTSPGNWSKGRIIQVYPSDDGHVRKVSLKTVAGLIDRPITRLIPLVKFE